MEEQTPLAKCEPDVLAALKASAHEYDFLVQYDAFQCVFSAEVLGTSIRAVGMTATEVCNQLTINLRHGQLLENPDERLA